MKAALLASRCAVCGVVTYPAQQLCGKCGNTMYTEPLPESGQLVTWTVVYQSMAGFTTPYVLAWATLDGGLGILGRFGATPGAWVDLLHAGKWVAIWEDRASSQHSSVWMEVEHD